ncbi:MAG: hypothetical protein ABIR34_12160 [Marmoricola sp.]
MTATSAPEESHASSGPALSRLQAPRSRSPLMESARRLERYAVLVIALVAVLVRFPYLATDASRDEAGFLLVGQQWHAGGSSLYGNYWVDRPPLLITIFRVAAQLGGLVPLRLIGCLATVLVILGTAHLARRLGSPGSAPWAALTAAALCVTPLLGGQAVNGELLSAPFVVVGLIAVLTAIDHPGERRATVAAALAGAAMICSLLVKQNMADVAVFASVVLLVAWRRGEIATPRLVRSILAAAAGAMACLVVVALWTMAHGTSVVGVFDAMYPFRIEAGQVMALSNRSAADARLRALALCWLLSGGAVLMAVTGQALVSRRLRSTAVWALVATVLFDVVSITLGGSYWDHYLIQLVIPIAVLSGLLVAHHLPGARMLLVVVALAAAVAVGVDLSGTHTTAGTSLGQAVREVSHPRDTIVTTWGHANVTRASGLSSPYPYLWSLPARTLDPKLAALDSLLSGPSAPTWFVTWHDVNTWRFHGGGAVTARVLAEHYNPVAQVNGHTIYLHRDVQRAVPRLSPPSTDLSAASASSNLPISDRLRKELP